jgi:hypothetical protein
LAKIGELVVWTNCGKPLKPAKILRFERGYFIINLSFSLGKIDDDIPLMALPQELRCVERILQKYLLITPFCWGYPLWNKRMKRELLDGRILFKKDSIDFLFYPLFIRAQSTCFMQKLIP